MSQIFWQWWMVRSIVYIRKVVKASVVCSIRSLRSVPVFVHCERREPIGVLGTTQRYGARCDTLLSHKSEIEIPLFRPSFRLILWKETFGLGVTC